MPSFRLSSKVPLLSRPSLILTRRTLPSISSHRFNSSSDKPPQATNPINPKQPKSPVNSSPYNSSDGRSDSNPNNNSSANPKGKRNSGSMYLAVGAVLVSSYYAYTGFAAHRRKLAEVEKASEAQNPLKSFKKLLHDSSTGSGDGKPSYSTKTTSSGGQKSPDNATFDDYQRVYNAIAKRLQEVDDDPEEGSYGPGLVRFAWHSSGTFDKSKNNEGFRGGSSGGTIRFKKEVGSEANKGLDRVRVWYEPLKDEFPWISHGDLYTLGGVAAVQELGGPEVKWRAGRVDVGEDQIPPNGRLPDASKGADYVRKLFEGRLGFSEEDTVALIGAHALGRCHRHFSGYDGPWTFSPTYFTNEYFKLLKNEKWHVKKWDGPKQFEDDRTKSLMMLPTDYCLIQDEGFKKVVDKFADDEGYFFKAFGRAFSNLLELGCNFEPNSEFYVFKRLEDQE